MILKVQDQPKLEARVGHSQIDAVRAGLLGSLVKPWMVPRPLDIEYAPELINLCVLFDGSGSVLSPSQKTTSVLRGLRVATFRLSGRPPTFRLLRLTVPRWPRDQAPAEA